MPPPGAATARTPMRTGIDTDMWSWKGVVLVGSCLRDVGPGGQPCILFYSVGRGELFILYI